MIACGKPKGTAMPRLLRRLLQALAVLALILAAAASLVLAACGDPVITPTVSGTVLNGPPTPRTCESQPGPPCTVGKAISVPLPPW
jgi:hypothetical protein